MSDIFKKYSIIDFSGVGKVIFDDNTDNTATFQIYQLNQGNVVGSILFRKIDISRLDDVIHSRKIFRFEGETVKEQKVSAERCAFYSTIFRKVNNLAASAMISRFLINALKLYNKDNLENLEKARLSLCFEIGVLDYYSRTNFSINTEIGEIQNISRLTDDDFSALWKLHIPINTSILRLKVESEKTFEITKQKIFKVVDKILELVSFALCTRIRWSYYSVYLNEFSASQLIYYESQTQLPSVPNPHNIRRP
jgi:hypothetical protein